MSGNFIIETFIWSFNWSLITELTSIMFSSCLKGRQDYSIFSYSINGCTINWQSFVAPSMLPCTKMNISSKDFFSICEQIRGFLRICSHLLKKFLMDNFFVLGVSSHLLKKSLKETLFFVQCWLLLLLVENVYRLKHFIMETNSLKMFSPLNHTFPDKIEQLQNFCLQNLCLYQACS